MLRVSVTFILLTLLISNSSGCAEGCPIVCEALDEDCPDECKTRYSAGAPVPTDGHSETTNSSASSTGSETGTCETSSDSSSSSSGGCGTGSETSSETETETGSPSLPTTTDPLGHACTDDGAPFGPCDAGTCGGANGYNAFCLRGSLGDVCVPTCISSCPASDCNVLGTCESGACVPACDDGLCPGAMVCDPSVGACVHPF